MEKARKFSIPPQFDKQSRKGHHNLINKSGEGKIKAAKVHSVHRCLELTEISDEPRIESQFPTLLAQRIPSSCFDF